MRVRRCRVIGRLGWVSGCPRVRAAYALFGDSAVVHRKGVHVQRQPAARQHPVVGTLAGQQPIVDAGYVLEHRRSLRVQPLAQRRARRQQPDAQRFLEKLVASPRLVARGVGQLPHHVGQRGKHRATVAHRLVDRVAGGADRLPARAGIKREAGAPVPLVLGIQRQALGAGLDVLAKFLQRGRAVGRRLAPVSALALRALPAGAGAVALSRSLRELAVQVVTSRDQSMASPMACIWRFM